MKVLTSQHAVQLAHGRADAREEWESDVATALRTFIRRGRSIEPFDEGSTLTALRRILLDIEAEVGDVRAVQRRAKNKLSNRRRLRILERDGFTCQSCGFQQTIEDVREASRQARETGQVRLRRFLTVDHVLPASEGGTSRDENLETLCSECNAKKGRALPEWLAGAGGGS